MIFVIGEDDNGNVIVNKTSGVGKSDQLIFLLEGVSARIGEIARTVTKLVGIIDYISRNVYHQDAVEEYTNLLEMPSESLGAFVKMENLGVKIQKNNSVLIKMYASKRKNKGRTRIRTRQQSCTLKYKRYELRIYGKLIVMLATKIFLMILAQ